MFYVSYLRKMEETRKALNRIKICLVEKDILQKTLADHMDVSEQTVSKWCNHITQPTLQELFDIADYLELDISEVLAKSKFSNKLRR